MVATIPSDAAQADAAAPAPATATSLTMRLWRGDEHGGAFRDYVLPAQEGEVVLDVVHRVQAEQAPDLAVRWNCKAGKCGSCSAEINGQPRLMCMTRMSTLPAGEPVTVSPMRGFPVIRDLVTDVSFNYAMARRIPALRTRPREPDGTYRMTAGGHRPRPGVPQVHRVLPVPERVPRDPRPRGEQAALRRPALLHPRRRAGDAPARHPGPPAVRRARSSASACATSPSAAPRSAPSTSTSPTTRSSPSRSASSTPASTRWPGSGGRSRAARSR